MKILGLVVVGLIVVAVSALFIVRSLESRVTETLVSQASQLEVPAGWTQTTNIVRREQFLCMSTNPCPSIARSWVVDTPVTVPELEHMAAAAGLTFSVEGTCQRPPTATGQTGICTLLGVRDGFHYQLWVSDTPQEPQQVSLNIRPNLSGLTQPQG